MCRASLSPSCGPAVLLAPKGHLVAKAQKTREGDRPARGRSSRQAQRPPRPPPARWVVHQQLCSPSPVLQPALEALICLARSASCSALGSQGSLGKSASQEAGHPSAKCQSKRQPNCQQPGKRLRRVACYVTDGSIGGGPSGTTVAGEVRARLVPSVDLSIAQESMQSSLNLGLGVSPAGP